MLLGGWMHTCKHTSMLVRSAAHEPEAWEEGIGCGSRMGSEWRWVWEGHIEDVSGGQRRCALKTCHLSWDQSAEMNGRGQSFPQPGEPPFTLTEADELQPCRDEKSAWLESQVFMEVVWNEVGKMGNRWLVQHLAIGGWTSEMWWAPHPWKNARREWSWFWCV